MTRTYNKGADPSQRLAREIWRAKNRSAAFSRTAKILQLATDLDLYGLDVLGDAIGAERLHRILSHGANQRDLTIMRAFVRACAGNRVRRALHTPKIGEARLRQLEQRRSATFGADQ